MSPARTSQLTPLRGLGETLTALGAAVRDSEKDRRGGPQVCAVTGRLSVARSESVRVFVLPQGAGDVGLGFRCSLEQEAEVRRDERVRRRHSVGVVNGAVLAREGDPARVLTQTIFQVSPDLARPLLEELGGVVDHPFDLGNLLRLLLGQREAEVK